MSDEADDQDEEEKGGTRDGSGGRTSFLWRRQLNVMEGERRETRELMYRFGSGYTDAESLCQVDGTWCWTKYGGAVIDEMEIIG